MDLVITLRKEVPDEDTANQLFQIVKTKLEDHPDILVSGMVNSRLILEPEPPG